MKHLFLIVVLLISCINFDSHGIVVTRTAGLQSPSSRFGHAMVYDTINQKVILFGGAGGVESSSEGAYILRDGTWIFDYNSKPWEKKDPIQSPHARLSHEMVFNPDDQKTFLFGSHGSYDGRGQDLWMYDYPSNIWTRIFTNLSPPARSDHSMIYDTTNQIMIMFGGITDRGISLNDLWVYNYNNNMWTEMHPTSKPNPRCGHTMFFDSTSNKVILFGGHVVLNNSDHRFSNEVWSYDYSNNNWTELHPINSPDPRFWHSMAYSQNTQKAIIFGGLIGGDYKLGDTWIYDYPNNEWVQIFSEATPSPRELSSMVFITGEYKGILFGGHDDFGNALGDTWSFDIITEKWSLLPEGSNSSNKTRNLLIASSILIFICSAILIKFYQTKRKKLNRF
ncbi:MAG: Kelch repeat-containing protein [Candidatus Kariarchaeaceae archaeon]